MSWPVGLAFDRSGDLFVANYASDSIYRFDPKGHAALFATTPDAPLEMTIDEWGNLYVTYAHMQAIQRFDPLGNVTTFFNTSPFGTAMGIAFIPEPSTGAILALAGALLIARWVHNGRGPSPAATSRPRAN